MYVITTPENGPILVDGGVSARDRFRRHCPVNLNPFPAMKNIDLTVNCGAKSYQLFEALF